MSPAAGPTTPVPRGARGWFWLQLTIGWLPVWALYATIIVAMHGAPIVYAMLVAARAIVVAALLGLLVLRLTERLPWPRPVTVTFTSAQLVAALAYALSWVVLTSLFESLLRGRVDLVAPAGFVPFAALGVWLYVAVAGVSYAAGATERAARAEAAAVKAQLSALRGQLNPHFLFNALHTVVQLIPEAPARAAEAAELLAGLLRTAIGEDRELVPLEEECAFVRRYVEIERLRFADRLDVVFDIDEEAADVPVPAFAVQTLVENAVRHGAAPRVEPTKVRVTARRRGDQVDLVVADTGAGVDVGNAVSQPGTGLRRLRERLDALYAGRSTLRLESAAGAGFTATLVIPIERSGGA